MTNPQPQALPWIISPWADCLLLVGAPLAIVPLLSIGTSQWWTPEQISLVVFAFASLGHHLPGFLRAYGDRQLFQRFRWRFLLAPPTAIAVCWLCFVHWRIHILELVLLFWATWHIMMQTYGFMRIYDAKLGRTSTWDARLDFWMCCCVFASGIIFSNARVFGITESMLLSGLPVLDAGGLKVLQALAVATTTVVGAVYVVRSFRGGFHLHPVNWLKLALLGATAALYWYAGKLSVNLLLGVAMFEIFHAVQYCAVVWSYQNSQRQRSANTPAPESNRSYGWRLFVYLIAITAFGLLGLWGRTSQNESVAPIALALFSASAILHFYYDGFIWKVREQETSEAFQLSTFAISRDILGRMRGSIATVCLTIALVSIAFYEFRQQADFDGAEHLQQLAALTPSLPEVQVRLSQVSLIRGDIQQARLSAQAAVDQRPRSYAAHFALARSSERSNDWGQAAVSYQEALLLRPSDMDATFRLGLVDVQRGEFQSAIGLLSDCIQRQPDHSRAEFQLGNAYFSIGESQQAIEAYRRCIVLEPRFANAHNNLGAAMFDVADWEGATKAYQAALKLDPDNGQSLYNLGLAYYLEGNAGKARAAILQARRLGVQPTPELAAALGL